MNYNPLKKRTVSEKKKIYQVEVFLDYSLSLL